MPPTRKSAPPAKQELKVIYITHRFFIHFLDPFHEGGPRMAFQVCLEHLLMNQDPAFIRMHNHAVGDAVTGLPLRDGTHICIKNEEHGGVRDIISISGDIAICLRTKGQSPQDVIEANRSFMRDQMAIYFENPRKLFKQKWSLTGIKFLDGEKLVDLERRFCPPL